MEFIAGHPGVATAPRVKTVANEVMCSVDMYNDFRGGYANDAEVKTIVGAVCYFGVRYRPRPWPASGVQ
ncbi:MAG: hypothetical protein NVS9B4_21810 [Candidatus Acidiferrum sp.]